MFKRFLFDKELKIKKESKEREIYFYVQIISWVSLVIGYSLLLINFHLFDAKQMFLYRIGINLYGVASVIFLLNLFFIVYFYIQMKREKADLQLRSFYLSPLLFEYTYLLFYFFL